jgi:hypothetical protein
MQQAYSDCKETGIVVRVVGTSPLSFELAIGAVLDVKKYEPSKFSRPTAGRGFKTSAYLLFSDETKVGRLSPASLKKLSSTVPSTCTVVEVDTNRKRLSVYFPSGK